MNQLCGRVASVPICHYFYEVASVFSSWVVTLVFSYIFTATKTCLFKLEFENRRIFNNDLAETFRLSTKKQIFNHSIFVGVPEQNARVTYDNILRLSEDPDVNDVIKFLREREIVHFQRFGEAIDLMRRKLNQRNVYAMNPAIDL